MLRLGLIGCGEHAEVGHAIPLARFQAAHPGKLELAAVCDLQREKAESFCRKFGFHNSYNNVDDMLAKETLDACIVVVPVDRICSMGIKLLQLGLPCTIEKPLGVSLPEIDSLREVAIKTGSRHMVSVNRRFMPFLTRAVQWTSQAGTLRYIRATMSRHARVEPEFLRQTAVHVVDAIRWIAGDIAEAQTEVLREPLSSGRWFALNLRLESGVLARIDVLPSAGLLKEEYELIGDGFTAVATCPFGPQRGLRCFQNNRLVIDAACTGMAEDVVHGFYDETSAFLNALESGGVPGPTIHDVYPSVELCLRLSAQAA